MTTKTTAQLLGDARDLMQQMIASGFSIPMRERQERRINQLKARLASESI